MFKATPKTITYLIYSNIALYFVTLLCSIFGINLNNILGLVPILVLTKFYIWQFFTYMFMHSGPMHLFFNLIMLWMFGSELCKQWGERFFIKFYFICGLGAGLCVLALSPFGVNSLIIPTVGASGAIFGLFLAYGIIFKKRVLYVFGIVPVEARILVIILGSIEFLSLITESNNTISHLAHLGGIATGWIYLKLKEIQKNSRAKRYNSWKNKTINNSMNVIYTEFDQNNNPPNNKNTWN